MGTKTWMEDVWIMKAYGYERDGERLLELKEVTLECSMEELKKLIARVL